MDLLQTDKDLKKMPYKIPEGYFAGLSERMAMQSSEKPRVIAASERTLWQILAPYAAMAAMFTVIALSGKALMGLSGQDTGWTETEEFIYTELMPVTGLSDRIYESDNSEYIADTEISDSDIVKYLIYTGVSLEDLNFNDYE